MFLIRLCKKIIYITTLIFIIQTNLSANILENTQQETPVEVTYTVLHQDNLDSLGGYAQIALLIFTSLLGAFFLRDKFE